MRNGWGSSSEPEDDEDEPKSAVVGGDAASGAESASEPDVVPPSDPVSGLDVMGGALRVTGGEAAKSSPEAGGDVVGAEGALVAGASVGPDVSVALAGEDENSSTDEGESPAAPGTTTTRARIAATVSATGR